MALRKVRAVGSGTAIVLVACFGLLPAASAHVEEAARGNVFDLGAYSATVDADPRPIFTETPTVLRAILLEKKTGDLITDGRMDIAFVAAPDTTTRAAFLAQANRTWMTNVSFGQPGNYTATVTVVDDEATYSDERLVTAYERRAFRLKAEDADMDIVTGRRTTFNVLVVDRATAGAWTLMTDLRVRIEHRDATTYELLGIDSAAGKPIGPGRFQFSETFDEPGLRILWFSSHSGNLEWHQQPPLEMHSIDIDSSSPGVQSLPRAYWVTVAVIGAVALALIMFRRR